MAGPKVAGPPTAVNTALWQTFWMVLAATAFGMVLGVWKERSSALEFFSGYLVELSLSVDNLFVFIMLFEYFRVPAEFQQRVLTWGIVGAIGMRGAMIVAGVAAVRKFRWMTLLFAGILLLSSVKLLMESDDDDDELTDNAVVKISRRLVGATSEYDGDKFFTETSLDKDDDGPRNPRKSRRVATPLLLTLVCVELSDVVFAVDSIPAVLGISTDPVVVYSSNIFAIAGLRALYTLVAKAVDNMVYLKPAVCLVLLFISLKMILEYFGRHISTALSLSVVVFLLSMGALLSACHKAPKRKHEPPAPATFDGGLGVVDGQYGGHAHHRRPRPPSPSGANGPRAATLPDGAYSAANDLSKVLV